MCLDFKRVCLDFKRVLKRGARKCLEKCLISKVIHFLQWNKLGLNCHNYFSQGRITVYPEFSKWGSGRGAQSQRGNEGSKWQVSTDSRTPVQCVISWGGGSKGREAWALMALNFQYGLKCLNHAVIITDGQFSEIEKLIIDPAIGLVSARHRRPASLP